MAGYNENFVNTLDDDFKCSICNLPLREPVQTRCGHRFCRECFEETTRRVMKYAWGDQQGDEDVYSVACPVDNVNLDHDKDVFPDKATERKILSLAIQCPSEGCEWTGALGKKETHMESCPLLIVSCTNENCDETMVRKDLKEHITVTCQWKIVHCCYCSESHAECQEKEHIGECKKYLVKCPAACGVEIIREKILDHAKNDCPLVTISCPYAVMGCDVKIPRNQVETHLQSAFRLHLDVACLKLHNTQEEFRETTRKLEEKVDSFYRTEDERITSLEKQLVEMKKVNDFLVEKVASQGKEITRLNEEPPQLSWQINGIGKILSQACAKDGKKIVLDSTPFYSSTYGYKLKVLVYPKGDKTHNHTYLSVFLVLMEGEFDAVLPWPFNQKVFFTLVDQQEESKDIVMEFTADPSLESCAKPTKVEKPGLGFARFISHKNLKTRRYIQNDSLLLEVAVRSPN